MTDRRDGQRRLLASPLRPPPRRHEVDDLVAATCAAALASDLLLMCNPYPADGMPLEVYDTIVADVRRSHRSPRPRPAAPCHRVVEVAGTDVEAREDVAVQVNRDPDRRYPVAASGGSGRSRKHCW